jgi:hypothetical protein
MEDNNPLAGVDSAALENLPRFNLCSFNVVASGVELSLIGSSQVVHLEKDGTLGAGSVPVAQLNMSIGAAKELTTVLGMIIGQYEEAFGEINTPYLAGLRQKG